MRAILLFTFLAATLPCPAQDFDPDYLATFSLAARDPATGELGFAVQSKAFAAGNFESLLNDPEFKRLTT